jgi:hypothetical protein
VQLGLQVERQKFRPLRLDHHTILLGHMILEAQQLFVGTSCP